MNEIDRKIKDLKEEIANLERNKGQGYVVEEILGCDEYTFNDAHNVICTLDGELAGIVVNQKIMKKYFADIGEGKV